MKVAMIGTGYVGLVSGTCFADFGHEVICVDKDELKIERLNSGVIPIYEPGLDVLVAGNVAVGRLGFTTSVEEAVKDAEVVFIAVGTPSRRGDGHADLSFVYAAAEEIAGHVSGYTVVVTKSTVPVGTGDEIDRIVRATRPDADIEVASNPEFLREGAAIEDFKRPDRVVIGAESDRAREVMRLLYRPLFINETPILFTGRRSAELIKYAANSFLAMKISFINEMADICEVAGANVQEIARGIGLDRRIGPKFLHPGPGFGGSCFPKDLLALARTAETLEKPSQLINAVIYVNADRKRRMSQRIIDACGGSVENKTIGVLGVTFKPKTDDMRDAPSINIVGALNEAGATIRAYDPAGMAEAKKISEFDPVQWCDGIYEVMADADALVIITEWDEFRALDLARVKNAMRKPIIVDLRNIYTLGEMRNAGITYTSIGRQPIEAASGAETGTDRLTQVSV